MGQAPWRFFGLTFVVAWTLWLAAAAATAGSALTVGTRALFFLPGTFAPGIVALMLTARSEGRSGIRALLSRLFDWQVGARWYAFAIVYLAVVKLAAALAHRVLAGHWPVFGPPFLLLFAAALFSTPFQAGEEIGWRGYALPRLAARVGLARASVLLGVVWATWHLPLFFIPGTTTTGQPFPVYALSVTALSVAMAWLWANTRTSLLPVMLMHAAVNNTKDIVPSALPAATNPLALAAPLMAWLTSAVLWLGAACFLFMMARRPAPRAATPVD